MNITYTLAKIVKGLTHEVTFVETHSQCIVSTNTWDAYDVLGGPLLETPKLNYTLQSGRSLYSGYVAQGYTA